MSALLLAHTRVLTASLLALALVMATAGCSKKEDPTATAPGTGSYKLDGRLIRCTARANVSVPVVGNGQTLLNIILTTVPEPASGSEQIMVEYSKTTGQPNSSYQPEPLRQYKGGQYWITFYDTLTRTLVETPGGGFSGTFSSSTVFQTPNAHITEGVFTDVRP